MKADLQIKVKIQLSANEWELYTCSMKCGTAARSLNAAATNAINTANSIFSKTGDHHAASSAAHKIWDEASHKFSKFGASDSEPNWHFYSLLDKYFYRPHGLES